MELMVYDETVRAFRKLNKSNFNDDIIWGTVFLKREAISEIKKYFHICGYLLVEKEHGQYQYITKYMKTKIFTVTSMIYCLPQLLS